MANKAIFTIGLEGNASKVAQDTATSIEGLSTAIADSEEKIKTMNADLRRLAGSSEAVKKEKDRLKAAIKGEKQEITSNVLELKKLGATSTSVAKQQKSLAEEQKRAGAQTKSLRAAFSQTGGPLNDLAGKMGELSEVTEGLGAAGSVAALGVGAAAAAVFALAGATVYGIAKLGQYIFETQSAARAANLFREAATGSANNAGHLGEQVAALSSKVPVAKSEINKLGLELGRAGLRGQTIVDTLNAVEQAAGAGDDELANFSKDLILRGQQFNRFSISPQELVGKNLRFDDVAGELAKQMHIGMNDARAALAQGQVPLERGAAALRAALEHKFSGINKELLLDPEKQVEKFKETLATLSSGVDIKPLLGDMHDLFDLFDPSKSVSGNAIKQLVTSIGTDLVGSVHSAKPALSDFIRGAVLGAIELDNTWLEFEADAIRVNREVFGDPRPKKTLNEISLAARESAFAVHFLATELAIVGGNLSLIGLSNPLVDLGIAAQWVERKIRGISWHDVGEEIVQGLVAPIKEGVAEVRTAVDELANVIPSTFKAKLKIHSPSEVMSDATEQVIAGVTNPLRAGSTEIAQALNVAIGPVGRAPLGATPGATQGSRGAISITNIFQIPPGGEKTAAALKAAGFDVMVAQAVERGLRSAGYG